MPGFAGIISRHFSDDLPDLQKQMILPLHRQEEHEIFNYLSPPCAMACVSFPFRDTIIYEDGIALIQTGEIVDTESIATKLFSHGDSRAHQYPLPKLLVELFRQLGPNSISGLNGLYAIAIWEEKAERLTLINDRYGMQKVYYWHTKDRFLFATEYKAISQHPGFSKKISEAAVSDLISVGYLLDNRTLFEDIQIVPPASIVTFEKGELSFETYWDYPFYDGPQKFPTTEYVDQMAYFTRQAVSRRVHDDSCLLVTGGLDSRTIVGMYEQVAGDRKVLANTIGREEAFDVIQGRKIAERLGYDFFRIPIDSTYLSQYAEQSTWITEGNMNAYASWIFAEGSFLTQHNIRYAVGGIGGEIVSGRLWHVKLLDKNINRVMDLFYRKNAFSLASKLLKPSIYKNIEGETFNAFKRKLAQAQGHHPFNQLDYMAFHQDFRRHASSHDVLGDYAIALDPFLDNDLVDYALSIPPELRATGFILKRMLRKHIPKLHGLGRPIENDTISPAARLRHPKFWNLYGRGTKRIKRVFNKPKRANGDSLENYVLPNTWMRTGSKEFILNILSNTDLLEDVFNMDEVNNLVTAHMEGRANEFEAVGALLTFALWRQLFCSPSQNRVLVVQNPSAEVL